MNILIRNVLAIVLIATAYTTWAQDEKAKEGDSKAAPTQYDLDAPETDASADIKPEDLREVVTTNAQGVVTHRYTVYEDAQGRLIKHGTYEEWYDNGQKAREVTYDHGKPNGRQVWYHTNGKVWMEFSTKMGVRDGTYMENWRTGKRKATIVYKDGKIIRR